MPLPLGLISVGAKLLGVGKFLRDFVKDNWKWIVPIVLVAGAYWYHARQVDAAYENGHIAGVQDEVKRQEQQIEIENRKNREFEQLLTRAVTDFGKQIARETAERVVQESQIKTRVNTIIRDNPIYQTCKVDPEVLDARNQIRRLGPKEGEPIVSVKFNEEPKS